MVKDRRLCIGLDVLYVRELNALDFSIQRDPGMNPKNPEEWE